MGLSLNHPILLCWTMHLFSMVFWLCIEAAFKAQTELLSIEITFEAALPERITWKLPSGESNAFAKKKEEMICVAVRIFSPFVPARWTACAKFSLSPCSFYLFITIFHCSRHHQPVVIFLIPSRHRFNLTRYSSLPFSHSRSLSSEFNVECQIHVHVRQKSTNGRMERWMEGQRQYKQQSASMR